MRSPSRLALAALLATAVLLLSGCVPPEPEVVPPPEPTSSPLFASDEEALAAATDAYEAYLKMSDLIAQEGGKEPERLAPYVTEEWLEQSVDFFNSFADSGRHQEGSSKVRDSTLQQHYVETSGDTAVVVYLCVDYASVKLLDQANQDTLPADSPSILPIEATLFSKEGTLKLAGNEPWTSDSFC